jgi:hypothetical protein
MKCNLYLHCLLHCINPINFVITQLNVITVRIYDYDFNGKVKTFKKQINHDVIHVHIDTWNLFATHPFPFMIKNRVWHNQEHYYLSFFEAFKQSKGGCSVHEILIHVCTVCLLNAQPYHFISQRQNDITYSKKNNRK